MGGGAGWQEPHSCRAELPKPPQLSWLGWRLWPVGHSVQRSDPAPMQFLQLESQRNVCSAQQPVHGKSAPWLQKPHAQDGVRQMRSG